VPQRTRTRTNNHPPIHPSIHPPGSPRVTSPTACSHPLPPCPPTYPRRGRPCPRRACGSGKVPSQERLDTRERRQRQRLASCGGRQEVADSSAGGPYRASLLAIPSPADYGDGRKPYSPYGAAATREFAHSRRLPQQAHPVSPAPAEHAVTTVSPIGARSRGGAESAVRAAVCQRIAASRTCITAFGHAAVTARRGRGTAYRKRRRGTLRFTMHVGAAAGPRRGKLAGISCVTMWTPDVMRYFRRSRGADAALLASLAAPVSHDAAQPTLFLAKNSLSRRRIGRGRVATAVARFGRCWRPSCFRRGAEC
jgi:hypothetical protein